MNTNSSVDLKHGHSLPVRSDWKECAVPVERLIEIYEQRVENADLRWRLPLSCALLAASFINAVLLSDTHSANSFRTVIKERLQETRLPSYGIEVLLTNAQVNVSSIPNPLFGVDDIVSVGQWQQLLNSRVLHKLCDSLSPDYQWECGSNVTHEVLFSDENELCYQQSSPFDARFSSVDAAFSEFFDGISCQENVFQNCFQVGFSSNPMLQADSEASSSSTDLFPASLFQDKSNECLAVTGIGSLASCTYQIRNRYTVDNLDNVTLDYLTFDTCKSGTCSAGDFGTLQFHQRVRAVVSKLLIYIPDTPLRAHVMIMLQQELGGRLVFDIKLLVDSSPIVSHAVIKFTFAIQVCVGILQLSRFLWDAKYNSHVLLSAWVVVDVAGLAISIAVISQGKSFTTFATQSSEWVVMAASDPCMGGRLILNKHHLQETLGVQIALLVLQCFKATKVSPKVHLVWQSLTQSIAALIPLFVMVVWYYISYAIAAMLLFGQGSLQFQSISRSMFALNMIAGSWHVASLYGAMESTRVSSSPIPLVYFFVAQSIFHWVLRNVVMAIVVRIYLDLSVKASLNGSQLIQVHDEYDSRISAQQRGGGCVGSDLHLEEVLPSNKAASQQWNVLIVTKKCVTKIPSLFKQFHAKHIGQRHSRSKNTHTISPGKVSMREVDILDRLKEWKRKKTSRYFISFNELRKLIGTSFSRRGVPRFTVPVSSKKVEQVFQLVEPYHIYRTSHVKEILSSWEKQHVDVVGEQEEGHLDYKNDKNLSSSAPKLSPNQLARTEGRVTNRSLNTQLNERCTKEGQRVLGDSINAVTHTLETISSVSTSRHLQLQRGFDQVSQQTYMLQLQLDRLKEEMLNNIDESNHP